MKPVKSTLSNMVAVLAIIAVCSATAIGYVYTITKAPIEEAKSNKMLQAIEDMVGTFDNNPFDEKIEIAGTQVELYPIRKNGDITAVAIKSLSNEGFGGKIELIIGILMNGTITGYKVIEQNETPGLGTKVTQPQFSKQFVGKSAYTDNLDLRNAGGEIDAVTGATISSKAVVGAVKSAVSAYNKFAGAKQDEE